VPTRKVVVAVVLCFLVVRGAIGFGGTEHRRISDNAFELARVYAARFNAQCMADNQLTLDYFNPDLSTGYGQMVVSVDHRVDPLKIFENARVNGGIAPSSPYDLDEYLVAHLLDIVQLTENFRALSVDDNHFQGQALANFELLHAAAVSLAHSDITSGGKIRGSLLGGVIVNSFASHYLQDIFAPGHIVTPRYGLHDAIAAGMHDKFNILGARFLVNPERWQELMDLLTVVKPGSDLERRLKVNHWRNKSFGSGDPIELWGDGDLWRSPSEELLVTLLTARSLVDVFESYCGTKSGGHDLVNSFLGSHFTLMHRNYETGQKYVLPQWKFAYGEMQVPGYGFDYPTVLGFTVGQETVSMPRAHLAARNAFEMDMFIPRQRPTSTDRNGIYRPLQPLIGLTAGYRYAWARNERVHAPVIRVISAWPMIHTQISVDIARRRYTIDGHHSGSRSAAGLRAQSGFSILKFDIGLMRDAAFVDRVGLRRGWTVQSGVTIEGPLLKVPGLRMLEVQAFKHRRKLEMSTLSSHEKAKP
jgi:hypothetical protein